MEHVIEVGRRERKRQAVHESLLRAGSELFRARGIAGTTVEDIAGECDVARQTFFNHFPYKEALAIELGSRTVQRIAERAQGLLEAGTPALEVLQQVAHWLLDMASAERELAVVVARELLHPEHGRANRADRHVPIRQMFEAVLHQAWEEGDLRKDISPSLVANRLSDVLTCMFAQVGNSEADRLHQELEICFDMMFNGITDRRS